MNSRSANGTNYTLTGVEGAPVVVFIHGLGLHKQTWRDYVPFFEQKYRVLNYDLYGHGKSVQPPAIPSLTLFATQLRELLDELDIERAVLIGFSLGGMINRRFAMDYPDRTTALAILNSPHERGEEQQKLVEERAAQTSEGGPGATIDATLERWFTTRFREMKSDVVDEIREWVLANDPTSYTQCRMVLANGVIELIRPQPPISTPSIVLTCENDSGSTPAMSLAIASEIAGAETVIVPRLQHMGLVEQPELFIRPMLAFLEKLEMQ